MVTAVSRRPSPRPRSPMKAKSVPVGSTTGYDAGVATRPSAPGRQRLDWRWLRTTTRVVLGLGIVLRLWQYLSNPPYWMDEIALVRNIVALPARDLVSRPLYYDQVAPRGFLLAEKAMSVAFGSSELALRVIPLVATIAGMVLFWRLAERILTGLAVPLAVLLFAIALPLIRYTAELKQYGLDVAAAVGLTLLAVDLLSAAPSARRRWAAGATGFVAVWFAQTAVIVLAGLGLALAIQWLITRERALRDTLLTTVPLWALGALLAVLEGRHSMTPSTAAFMQDFWGQGFMPWPLHGAEGIRWFWGRWEQLFAQRNLLRYPWAGFYVVLAAAGLVAIWRRSRTFGLLISGPLVVALVAAMAHQYPLHSRVALYLVPSLLLASAAAIEWGIRVARERLPVRAWVPLGGALVGAALYPPVAAFATYPVPFAVEDWPTIFTYLRDHRAAGDSVYVFGNTASDAIFFGPRYGLPRSAWRPSACSQDDARVFLRDVDRFRGAGRVWVVMNGLPPLRTVRGDLRAYLGTIGVRRDSLLFRKSLTMLPLGVELYDLSDPVRLRAASSATFPVHPIPTDPRPGCRDWTMEPIPR